MTPHRARAPLAGASLLLAVPSPVHGSLKSSGGRAHMRLQKCSSPATQESPAQPWLAPGRNGLSIATVDQASEHAQLIQTATLAAPTLIGNAVMHILPASCLRTSAACIRYKGHRSRSTRRSWHLLSLPLLLQACALLNKLSLSPNCRAI